MSDAQTYHPGRHRLIAFHSGVRAFLDGSDTPRAYLERCLQVIAEREPVLRAWVVLNESGARAAADASSARYRAGKPLSPVDGMPVGIKDLLQTRDMPTQMGSVLFAGHHTHTDSACVQALRRAGAVILGKTVTTELGFSHPGPTTNPFDASRTPGGSSSGSAAAVGAGMVPAAIGSQVVGSVIRPASFCANVAIKPTLGALNRGERTGLSQSHLGVHAGNLEDMWAVAHAIAHHVGGDPGHPGLYGDATPAPAMAPRRLILVETEGWVDTDAATRTALLTVLEQLQARGVAIIRRADSAAVEGFEAAIADALALARDLCGWEMRWTLRNLLHRNADGLSRSMLQRLELAEAMSADDYRDALERRAHMRARLAALAPLADALITLSATGPAPPLAGAPARGEPGIEHTTGLPAYNAWTSALGAPAITLPLLAVQGMPVGVQIIGQPHADWRLGGLGRWLLDSVTPVSV